MSRQYSLLGLISSPVAALIAFNSFVPTISAQNQNLQSITELIIEVEKTPEVPKISERELAVVKKVIERRLQILGIFNSNIQTVSKNQISLQIPGVKDPQAIAKVLESKAQLELRQQKPGTQKQLFTLQAVRVKLKARQKELRNINNDAAVKKNQQDLAKNNREIAKLFTSNNPPLTSRYLKDAYSESPTGTNWNIGISFDTQGSQLFNTLTKKLAGTGRSIGIFLDNELISAPIVGPEYADTGITGGKAIITGQFTAQQAKDLTVQLRGGALPLPVKIKVMTQKK
jgi:preprotein translocase subunit SecD